MKALQLFVFDMAGTTVNEENLVYQTLYGAFLFAGFTDLELEDVLEHGAGKEKRQATRDILAAVFPEAPDQSGTAERIHAHFRKLLVEAYVTSPVTAFPGSEDFLAKLRATGIKIPLNTGYDCPTAQLLLGKMGWSAGVEYDVLVTATDVDRGRPYPDMIHLAMEQTGIKDPALVVELEIQPSIPWRVKMRVAALRRALPPVPRGRTSSGGRSLTQWWMSWGLY